MTGVKENWLMYVYAHVKITQLRWADCIILAEEDLLYRCEQCTDGRPFNLSKGEICPLNSVIVNIEIEAKEL